MNEYLDQLMADIARATTHVERPYTDYHENELFWLSEAEEERTAPRRSLEEWTGIRKAQLPPHDQLDDAQVGNLLEIEVEHIKRKYGDDWKKYYPYHLDPEYDDEHGNPHDYGVNLNDDIDPADWWR